MKETKVNLVQENLMNSENAFVVNSNIILWFISQISKYSTWENDGDAKDGVYLLNFRIILALANYKLQLRNVSGSPPNFVSNINRI